MTVFQSLVLYLAGSSSDEQLRQAIVTTTDIVGRKLGAVEPCISRVIMNLIKIGHHLGISKLPHRTTRLRNNKTD